MKKILLVTRPIAPPWDEASKNFAFNLAMNLPDFEFGLLTNGTMENMPKNISQHPIYTSNKNNFTQKLRLIANLRKIAADYDIIHCLFTPTKLNSNLLRNLLKGKKIIQTIATLREDLFCDCEIKKLMFGDLLITYSDYSKNKLGKLGFTNIKRIYPGIDLKLYSPAEKDKEIQKLLNVTDEDFVIQYTGEYVRLGATNDLVGLIIRYVEEFRKRKIKLCFPGRKKGEEDIKKKAEIKKIFQDKNVTDVVRFADEIKTKGVFRDDFMRRRYNTSDLIIFPVRDMKGKFDVPLAVIEAMACEKPVIISNLPILREFSSEINSVIIESGNQEQLKDAIIKLYEDKNFRELIGKNARKFVEEKFNIKNSAEQYGEIYNIL